jgi:CelD/BcsL family acetyltransferase involved in cellulose biosynthesis
MIKVYSDFSDELKTLWVSLERSLRVSVFQTVAWCESAWLTIASAEKGASLSIIVRVGQDGEIPVLFPTFIDSKKRLRFINDTYSDYGDVLYEPSVNKYHAFREIVEYIRNAKEIKSIALQKIKSDSELIGYMGSIMNDAIVYRDHAYSYVEIPKGIDICAGLAHFNADDRKHFNRLLKKSSNAAYERISYASGMDFPEERILKMVEIMRSSRLRRRDFLNSRMMEFARRIYQKGICEIVVLSDDGEDVAISFQLKKDKVRHCWICLYRIGAWNSVRLAADAKNIAENEGGFLDLGVGFYGYKQETFRPESRIVFSVRWGRGFFEKCYAYLRMNWRFLRVGVR